MKIIAYSRDFHVDSGFRKDCLTRPATGSGGSESRQDILDDTIEHQSSGADRGKVDLRECAIQGFLRQLRFGHEVELNSRADGGPLRQRFDDETLFFGSQFLDCFFDLGVGSRDGAYQV